MTTGNLEKFEVIKRLEAQGFPAVVPPWYALENFLYVSFDIYGDRWQAVEETQGATKLIKDGFVPWPIPLTNDEVREASEVLRVDLQQICLGRPKPLPTTESTAYRPDTRLLSWHTSLILSETRGRPLRRRGTRRPTVLTSSKSQRLQKLYGVS